MRYLLNGVLCFFLVQCSLASGATLRVPEDFFTIQGALNAAGADDVVSVAPGMYLENLEFKKNGVTLLSRIPHAATINGAGLGHVVSMGEFSGTVEGFVITGSGNNSSGVILHTAAQVVRNNIIKGNDWGVWTYWYSKPLIEGNRIEDNTEAGIVMYTFSKARVVNNYISGNALGIWVSSAANGVKIINNTITQNVYNLSIWGTKTIIANNIIARAKKGIHFFDSTYYPDITTFVSQFLDIHHNNVWDNLYDDYYAELGTSPGSTIAGPFLPMPGSSEIHVDPIFVGAGDLHILHTSPCRDAGDASVAALPVLDFEGDPRVAYGAVDMGADEFYTHLYVTGNLTPGGAVQGKLVGLPGTTPVGLFIGSDVLAAPVPTLWGGFFLQPPWVLVGPLGAIPADGVMALPATLPVSPPAPYDVPAQALIGLNPDSLTNVHVLQVR
jgi:parallel beta-helix repeat protein